MNQFIIQDVRQIRSICQQLAQNERQNAQMLWQQAGMQHIAQRETFASQQLQHCVDLCNRIEQSLSQTMPQQGYAGTFANYVPSATGISHYPALNQVMQADRQPQQQGYQPQAQPQQQTYGAGAGYGAGFGGGINPSVLQQVMQADRQPQQQAQQQGYQPQVQPPQQTYGAGAGYGVSYGGGYNASALQRVMQADHQATTN